MSTNERRKLERFPLKLDVNLSVEKEKGMSTDLTLRTENVCAGGAYMVSGDLLPVGTDVDLDLILPLGKFKNMAGKRSHIKVSGAIIRTCETGMAVLFNKQYKILLY